jgi:Chaperone of endosialidase
MKVSFFRFDGVTYLRSLYAIVLFFLMAIVLPRPAAVAVTPPGGGYPNENTALGDNALFSLTIGTENTAIGFEALYSTDTGGGNTAVGDQALQNNTSGGGNTAVGLAALRQNLEGKFNTAVGQFALSSNTVNASTAVGYQALNYATTGPGNVAVGFSSLYLNTTGSENTSIGTVAMSSSSTGSYNVAIGHGAMNLANGSYNIAIGDSAALNLTGNNNIVIGGQSAGINLSGGSNNIDLGNQRVAGESNVIRIGTAGTQTATYVAPSIRGVAVGGLQPIGVSANGQLGIKGSSFRFKEAIKPMDQQSEAILALRPVSFRYKKELDPKGAAQFGLVAEEVAKVDPDLVVTDDQGKPFSFRYDEVNAMLLNEFLEEHRKLEDLEATVRQLRSSIMRQVELETTVSELKTALKKQETQIQKVSAQMRTKQDTPRLVSTKE